MRPRMLTIVLFVTVMAACSSGSDDNDSSPPAPSTPTSVAGYPLDSTLRLDQTQVLGSHNSYHGRPYAEVLAEIRSGSAPALADTLDYEHAPLPQQFELGVRQIELDVFDDPDGGKYANPELLRRLNVQRPEQPQMLEPGYKVIHEPGVDTNSTCLTFTECLGQVKTWSDAHPGHVPIQIQIEMKDSDVTEPMFQRLESEITSVFARDDYFTPDDVRGDAATLGEAVSERGWPTLGTVRGKVYFTLDNGGLRDAYLEGHPSLKGRLIFTPSSPGEDDAAFAKLNDPVGDATAIQEAIAANMIVRTRADADTFEARENNTATRTAALTGGAHIVSTDYERPDPTLGNGYTVAIPDGTPARCNPVNAPPDCKPTDVEDPARLAG
jgi:hypothetical protein